MELLNYILIGLAAILVLWLWRVSRKLKKVNQDILRLNRSAEIFKNRLAQIEAGDLDSSAVEDQLEDNTQEMLSYVQQEIGEANKKIRDIDGKIDGIDERLDDVETRMEE